MSPTLKALIPMKAHSERVPHKNVRPLCGRPLFHWVLLALSASPYVEEIVIDTDSKEIAQNARDHFEVTVLMRPERLYGDMVGITPLIDFEISEVSGEYFLQTHSTNPMLKTETINRAAETFFGQTEHDSLFSVTPWQTRFYWPDGRPVNHDPENMLRTQDLPPIYEENSNFYIFSRTSFYANNHRIGASPILFSMDPLEAVDIDEEADFQLAECLMAKRLAERES
jgi:CMP-N-acetylneuraminic acid synthetase